MPARVVDFDWDPNFDDNLLHWRGSLNPVGDVFRRVADKAAKKVVANAKKEANEAVVQMQSFSSSRFSKSGKLRYKQARSMTYSLKKYAELVKAIEVHDPHANYSAVIAGHAAGVEIEFGGTDSVIENDGVHLTYPALGLLRRSI
jgi:hypothetical protein